MTVRADALPAAVSALPQALLCVGYSGGLDSTALLHALAAMPAARERGLRAWHVHHGLHEHADAWAAHCQSTCDALGIALTVARVQVAPRGQGREAAARHARSRAFVGGPGGGGARVL